MTRYTHDALANISPLHLILRLLTGKVNKLLAQRINLRGPSRREFLVLGRLAVVDILEFELEFGHAVFFEGRVVVAFETVLGCEGADERLAGLDLLFVGLWAVYAFSEGSWYGD